MDERHPFICENAPTTIALGMIRDFALRTLRATNEIQEEGKGRLAGVV